MMAIRSILVLVALYGRRGLRLAPPGWPAITIDEFRLLQLFAAAQRGKGEAVEAHLAWMLRPGHAANPEVAVEFVACTLRCHGLPLPCRQDRAGTTPPPPVP